MAESHRTYDNRLRFLEKDIVDQRGKIQNQDTRNDNHSAKLKYLERALQEMKAENDALFDEVVHLKSDGIRSRMDDEYRYEHPRLRFDEMNDTYKYQNSSLQHGDQWVNKENEKAESDRNEFQNIAPEEELPESLRLHGYYRFKAIPYRRQMLLNDNYELISPRGGVTQRQKDNEKQDDKLYGTYSKHLNKSDAVRPPLKTYFCSCLALKLTFAFSWCLELELDIKHFCHSLVFMFTCMFA